MKVTGASAAGLVGLLGACLSAQVTPPPPGAASTPADAPVTVAASDRVDLRPKFRKGQELWYRLRVHSEQTTETVGDAASKQSQTFSHDIGIRRRTVEVSETGVTLEVSFETLTSSMRQGATSMSFDSAAPAEPSATEKGLAPMARAFLGKPVTVKLDAGGRFVEASGNDELAKKSVLAASLLNDEMFAEQLGPVYALQKDEQRLRVGETWSATTSIPAAQIGTLKIVAGRSLAGVEGQQARVAITGAVTFEPNTLGLKAKAAVASSEVAGSQTWSLSDGFLLTHEQSQSLVMSSQMPELDPAGKPNGLNQEKRAENVVRVTIDRLDGPPSGHAPSTP